MKQVVLVDRRKLYEQDGASTVQEWLSNYLGIGYMKACDFVRIAMTLESLPKMDEAYTCGRLSYDHLRALAKSPTATTSRLFWTMSKDCRLPTLFVWCARSLKYRQRTLASQGKTAGWR